MEEKKKSGAAGESVQGFHPLLLIREMIGKLWLALAVAIIVGCLAYIGASALYSPEYKTQTTFVVSVREGSSSVYSNLAAAKNIASSFSEIVDSDVMKKRVAAELGTDRVGGEISASVIEETNLIELTVTADNPRSAYLITRAVLNNYGELAEKTLSSVTLEILRQPGIPISPSNTSGAMRAAKLGAIASAAVVLVWVCLKAYLRDTVKVTEDVEKKLDVKLLATVYHERKYKSIKEVLRRRKKSILITNPTTGFAFSETFRKLRTRVDYHMRREGAKVIMVTSVLENEGKSTVAANLALAMNRKRKNVILIDGDMKKPALHKIMNYQDKQYAGITDYLDGKAGLKDTLISDKNYQMGLILGKKGSDRSTELVCSPAMRELIRQARENVDCIIIDTPPMSVSPDAECIAELADASILVVRQDTTPVKVINDAIDTLSSCNAKLIGCVFNNVRSADLSDGYSYGSGGKYGYGGHSYSRYGYGKYGYGNHKKQDVGEEREA